MCAYVIVVSVYMQMCIIITSTTKSYYIYNITNTIVLEVGMCVLILWREGGVQYA